MLESYGLTSAIQPTGGWRFIQPLKDGTTERIPFSGCAGSCAQLVKLVRDYRIVHNIELDTLESDIAEFIKRESPINNRFPNRKSKAVEPEKPKRKPLISRIRDSIETTAVKKPKLLSIHDARQRAEICAGCPQNVRWQTKCEPCNEEVVNKGQNMRRVAVIDFDFTLNACRLHDFYLPAFVFVSTELPKRHIEAPLQCWIPNDV